MLVTFRTKAYADITMFGDIAVALLRMMGQRGDVPGAILADDVGGALAQLRQSLSGLPDHAGSSEVKESDAEHEGKADHVALARRAYPLVELLSAAAARKCDVMWDS